MEDNQRNHQMEEDVLLNLQAVRRSEREKIEDHGGRLVTQLQHLCCIKVTNRRLEGLEDLTKMERKAQSSSSGNQLKVLLQQRDPHHV